MAAAALTGIRVLDFSRLLPGPFASLVLADLGAEVDKIEDLEGGDYLRHMPPTIGDTSAMFLALNRGKRSAAIDLKRPEAQAVVLHMLKHYDVVLEQFRPGVMDRLGLSHAAMRDQNERLIICSLTGYGQTGPLAKRAGHDVNYLARAGVLGFQGPADGTPQVPGFQLADISGGMWCVIGILAALHERHRSGKGKVIDVSMVESSMGFAVAAFGAIFGGQSPTRGGEPLSGGIAAYNVYRTKDSRAMSLGALEPKFWLTFAAAVGLPADMSGIMPGPHQTELREKLAAIFLTKTRAEWEAFAKERDVCLEPVLEPDELGADRHLVARRTFFDIESSWGQLRQLALPITDRDAVHEPPPKQGEQTEEILRDAAVDASIIAHLRDVGAIR